jgi:hypothetical protein
MHSSIICLAPSNFFDRFSARLRTSRPRCIADAGSIPEELDRFLATVRERAAEVAARLEKDAIGCSEWNSSAGPVVARDRRDRAAGRRRTTRLSSCSTCSTCSSSRSRRSRRARDRLGSAGVLVDDFPGLKADGLTATRGRAPCAAREDLQFLTWDHPLASGALDMLLGPSEATAASHDGPT